MSSPHRRPRWTLGRVAGALLVAALLVESIVGLIATNSPALRITVSSHHSPGGQLTVQVDVDSGRPFPMTVHAALVPGSLLPAPKAAYILLDPSYPLYYGSYSDTLALFNRVNSLLPQLGSSTTLRPVTAADLPSILASNPGGELVVAEYGTVPPTVLSNSSSELRDWLSSGGTLIWAGGPLGFFTAALGTPLGGCCPGGPGWSGQTSLVGYPLVDPAPINGSSLGPGGGPPLGSVVSPFAAAFGFEYNGTLFGADLSQLFAHGGTSLGYANTPNTPSPRTSLAYVPVGAGRIYYFGGGIWAPGGNFTPLGGLSLSIDVSRLLADPFIPQGGPTDVEDLSLAPAGSVMFTLTGNLSIPGIVLVTCLAGGVPLWEYVQPTPSLVVGVPPGGRG